MDAAFALFQYREDRVELIVAAARGRLWP